MPNSEITLDELFGRIDHLGDDEVVLDVRRPDEYEDGHIPGSINISHTDVADKITELKKYKKIYIHCKAGGRARQATAVLEANGFNNLVCISDAGMDAWRNRGYPIEN
ncbi:MAG: rhodanese-like domain-containing protein [Bdellovibrionales bacterium]|nr:rhodanese-like domain-containing protein [Bdellovibrionales bacterium]